MYCFFGGGRGKKYIIMVTNSQLFGNHHDSWPRFWLMKLLIHKIAASHVTSKYPLTTVDMRVLHMAIEMAAVSISAAISHATQLLGYGKLRDSQEQAVREGTR